MKVLLPFLLCLPLALAAQVSCGGPTAFSILHFTKTNGFDHGTRSQSAGMFDDIGDAENFTIVDTDDEAIFDDLTALMTFEVIVFSNTTGNNLFNATQRANLEAYIAAGGAFLGIHGATDMYRDASYPFYTNLVGGSRRNSPPHTSNNFAGTMDKIGSHPSTENVPDPWAKAEEYYYWPDTGLVSTIVPVLQVQSTGSNSYDAARPASWYQTFPSGARSFYTTMGHARSNFTDETNDFRQHITDAVCWLVEAEDASLPVTILRTEIERENGADRISWQLVDELASRVELHGGYDQFNAQYLTSVTEPEELYGELEHRPEDPTQWFYYRLKFLDGDGFVSWGEWLAAAPTEEVARPQVQYEDGLASLLVPSGGPAQAMILDAGGRLISLINLTEGNNALPGQRPGVYFIRFPFRGKESLRYRVR
jgi:type 1 glutamine amidotransferase